MQTLSFVTIQRRLQGQNEKKKKTKGTKAAKQPASASGAGAGEGTEVDAVSWSELFQFADGWDKPVNLDKPTYRNVLEDTEWVAPWAGTEQATHSAPLVMRHTLGSVADVRFTDGLMCVAMGGWPHCCIPKALLGGWRLLCLCARGGNAGT